MQRTSSARYARAARHFCLGATRSHSHLCAHAPRTPARGVFLPISLSLSLSFSQPLYSYIMLHPQWHLGHTTRAYTPTYRGYDTFYGYYNAMTEDYWSHTHSVS